MLTTEQEHLLVLHKHATGDIKHLTTAPSVLPLYTSLAYFLAEDGGVVNSFLDSVDVKNLSSLLLVGISRLLYTKRDVLSNWADFTDRGYEEFCNREGEAVADSAFSGLLTDAMRCFNS